MKYTDVSRETHVQQHGTPGFLEVEEGQKMRMQDDSDDVAFGYTIMGCGLCCSLIAIGMLALQMLFIFEVSARDAQMQEQCGTAFWSLILAQAITSILEMSIGLAWKLTYQDFRWAHVATRLAFAIAFTIVLARLPGGISGCNRALEQAAGTTHSYALMVLAFFMAVGSWLGFMGGACGRSSNTSTNTARNEI